MTETKTPGQIAYEASARALNLEPSLTWSLMPARHRDAWEQAAQAVLAHAASVSVDHMNVLPFTTETLC